MPLALDTSYHSTKGAPSLSFSTSASPTRILLANRCVDHSSCSYLLQIVTRISDQQNLINCNQSDSTHSFLTKICFSACCRVTLVPNAVSPSKGGTQSELTAIRTVALKQTLNWKETHLLETQSNTRLLILFIY